MVKIEQLYKLFQGSKGVITDTRKDLKDKIFFALKGPNFNGNQYAEKALSQGASYAVVDENIDDHNDRILGVSNVLETLQSLAYKHRKELGTRILGITGSNGKTTNKELINHILSKKFKCYATAGNLNNHIGVPLSLLELTNEHEIAIIEMGANKSGDIKELCEIADPDMGYITNIGIAHLEGFGSQEAILKEKTELYKHVMANGGKIYVNSAEDMLLNFAKNYDNKVVVGSDPSAKYNFQCLQVIPFVTFAYKGLEMSSPLYGDHNFENLKMAAAISLDLGVEEDFIKEAVAEYTPTNSRSQIINVNGLHVFLDAYNANPSSMKASIGSFSVFESEKKSLILGDMLELGKESARHHVDILEFISGYDWKNVFLVGQCFCDHESSYPDFTFFKTTRDVDQAIGSQISEGDYILIKGSRGLALEQLSVIQPQK